MPYLGNELATQFQAFVTQTITGDGSTGYTLDRAVANGKELLVYINNVKQEEGSGKSYTASGTTITFSEAVASGDSCYVVFLGSAVQTVVPPDGSLASYTGNASISGTFTANGGAVFNEDSADVDFRIESNGDANMFFVDAGNDRIYMGRDTTDGVGNARLQIEAQDGEAGLSIHRGSASSGGGKIFFSKSRAATAGDDTVVQDGDQLGALLFTGADGTDRESAGAEISVEVDGTPGGNDMPGRIKFATTADGASSVTERMRIKSSGVIMIPGDHTDGSGSERISISVTSGSVNGINFMPTGASGTNTAIACRTTGGSFVGGVQHNNTSTSFPTSSDYRLKENVVTEWDATTRLKQLKPSRFNFKVNPDKTQEGFLAHEVSSIVPEAVNGEKDALDKNGNIEPQSIDHSKLVPLLTKALQEAVSEIDTLKEKVKALESK